MLVCCMPPPLGAPTALQSPQQLHRRCDGIVHKRNEKLNVVILGGTRGLGRAMSIEFARRGNNVMVAGRDPETLRYLVLQQQKANRNVIGVTCDAGSPQQVWNLADAAQNEFSTVHMWINCIGMSGGRKLLAHTDIDDIHSIADSTIVGSMLGTREAIRIMSSQGLGHVVNVLGHGSFYESTPLYAAYGAGKAAVRHFTATVRNEMRWCGLDHINLHTLNPGLVRTSLLYDGLTEDERSRVDILASTPYVVAKAVVPRLEATVNSQYNGHRDLRFMSPVIIASKLITHLRNTIC